MPATTLPSKRAESDAEQRQPLTVPLLLTTIPARLAKPEEMPVVEVMAQSSRVPLFRRQRGEKSALPEWLVLDLTVSPLTSPPERMLSKSAILLLLVMPGVLLAATQVSLPTKLAIPRDQFSALSTMSERMMRMWVLAVMSCPLM